MTEMELYQSWRKNAIDDPDLQSELSAMKTMQKPFKIAFIGILLLEQAVCVA